MDEAGINRINELARKAKSQGLSEEERLEQAALRKAYIEAVKANISSSLNNVRIVEKDGSLTELKKKSIEK